MKKLLALMVAMLMVLGLASFAAADIEFSGDARVRGTGQTWDDGYTDPDTGATSDLEDRWYDHRVRLKVHGFNDDGAGAKARITLASTSWDESAGMAGSQYVGPKYGGDDYVYMYVAVADNWTLSGGWMPADWGLKWWAWSKSKQRLKIVGKLDFATVGFFTEKVAETRASDETNDYDVYAGFIISQLGEFKVGAIVVMQDDSRTASTADSGNKINIFFNGKIGEFGLMGEIAQHSGDINESSDGDNPMGGFIKATASFSDFNLGLALAATSNEFVSDNDFTPSVLIGTSQPTAFFDLGEMGDTVAIVFDVGTKISDAMSIGGVIAYATIDAYPTGDALGTWTEVDAKFSYALGENTSYWANVGFGSWEPDGGDSENVSAMGHGISTSF